MRLLTEQVLNGLALAGPVLLVAVALSSSIAALRLFNIAVGGIYVFSAVVSLQYFSQSSPVLLVVSLVILPVIIMIILELGVFRWQRFRADTVQELELGSVALTASLAAVFVALTVQRTAGQDIALRSGTLGYRIEMDLLGVHVNVFALLVFGIALGVAVMWQFVLSRTSMGKKFRAVTQDIELAVSLGVRVHRVALVNAVVSGLLLGIAGVMVLMRARAVGPESAGHFLLLPLAAVLLGGLDNIKGAVIASVLFGVIGAVVSGYAPRPEYADVAVFSLLFLVLLVSPEGLGQLSKKVRTIELRLPVRKREVS